MFDERTLSVDRKMKEEWERLLRRKYKEVGEYRTLSGIPIKPAYSASDIDRLDIAGIGMPGMYPFTRSIYPLHYQFQPWMMQQVLGYGLAEHTRERMDLMVKEGVEGYFGFPVFNIVFDNPTKGGIDPDNPEARGHVGLGGMSFSNLRDMEILLKDLPLDKANVSLITGDTCLYALACYIVAAEKMGFTRDRLHGNSMNWLVKGFCVDNPDFKPEGAMKLMVELIRFCTAHMPYWNTTNISGYLIREAGANAVQELAFTMHGVSRSSRPASPQGWMWTLLHRGSGSRCPSTMISSRISRSSGRTEGYGPNSSRSASARDRKGAKSPVSTCIRPAIP